MSRLECGCDITDHRPGGEFLLFAGNTLLGRSELEWEDADGDAWLRSGAFIPAETYFPFQDLSQHYTREFVAARLAQIPYNRETLKALTDRIESLHLRLLHSDGTEIPVALIDLQDCADTPGEEPRNLEVEIRDSIVHERFFATPTDS